VDRAYIHLLRMLVGLVYLTEAPIGFLVEVFDGLLPIITLGFRERFLSIKYGLAELDGRTPHSWIASHLHSRIEKVDRGEWLREGTK
jgi:hypothetical protein